MTTERRQLPATSTRSARTRLLYLDNIRILLTVLVVLHHAALTYGNIPVWFYTEPAQDPSGGLLDVFSMVNQAFFMGFFFLISGYFVPASLDRKGTRPFLVDRLRRLGIPLLGFLVLLRPLANLSSYLTDHADTPYWLYYLVSWDPGPLWFVEVLLVFCVLYALWRRVGPRNAHVTTERSGPPRYRALLVLVLVLGVTTYLWRIAVPTGTYVPVLGLPSPDYLPQYAILFGVGVLAHRHGWFDSIPRTMGRVGLGGAVLAPVIMALPFVIASSGGTSDVSGGGTWQSLVMALGQNLFAVGIILQLLVLYQRRFDHQRSLATSMSGNAYAVYVIHPVVLVAVSAALSALPASAIVKFLVVGAVAVPLCFLGAGLVRRLPIAREAL